MTYQRLPCPSTVQIPVFEDPQRQKRHKIRFFKAKKKKKEENGNGKWKMRQKGPRLKSLRVENGAIGGNTSGLEAVNDFPRHLLV